MTPRGLLRRWRGLPDPGAPSETERDLSRYEALTGKRRRLVIRLHEIRKAAAESRFPLEARLWVRWHKRLRSRLAEVEAERGDLALRLGIADARGDAGGGEGR